MLDMLITQALEGLSLPGLRGDGRVVQGHQRPLLGRDIVARERVGIRRGRRGGLGVVRGRAGGHAGADEECQGCSPGQAQGRGRPRVSHAVSMPWQRVPSS